MEGFSAKIFELLAGFADRDSDREVYLKALGNASLFEQEEDRHERLLQQLGQGEYLAALKAYLQLVAVADEGIQQQLRSLVRDRLYSSSTDERLRTTLVAYFRKPRVLEEEDVRVLLASCPDWLTENNLARAQAVREAIAERASQEPFRVLLVAALRELNSQIRSFNAAYAQDSQGATRLRPGYPALDAFS